MADPVNQSALTKFGPIGAPAAGALLMVVFIIVALMVGDTDAPSSAIASGVSKVNSILQDPKVPDDPKPEFSATGLEGADKTFGVATGGNALKKVAGEHKILDFPMQAKVFFEGPSGGDSFDDCDIDPKDNKLSKTEYLNTAKAKLGIKFNTLQKDNDRNYLSREEYEQNLPKEDIDFDNLDSDEDGKLSRSEYERSGATNFDDKDISPKDSFLSRDEYKAGIKKEEYDLDAPANVTAVADAKSFTITVKWTAPALKLPPPDLVYILERYSPADVAERKAKRNQELADWRKADDAWKAAFEKWKKEPGNENKTAADFPQPRPIKPPEVTEWERILFFVPGTETQYEDKNFRPNFTYQYRVTAASGIDPKKFLPESKFAAVQTVEGMKHSNWAEQAGRPVVIYNRVEMAWHSKSGNVAKIRLTRFHRINLVWLPVEVIQDINLDDELSNDVGGIWTCADIKMLNYEIKVISPADPKGDAAALKALEASKDRMDFTTGWVLTGFSGSDIVLQQKGGGPKFVLPKETNKEAAIPPNDPSAMANPITLRLAGNDVKAGTARFELTRWKQIEGKWYRVVILHDVKKEDAIGMEAEAVKQLSTKDMIAFYDAGGAVVKSAAIIAQLQDTSFVTDLKFMGVTGRAVDLGGGVKMDILGVWFVEGK